MQWWRERKQQVVRISIAVAIVLGVDLLARLVFRLAMPDAQDDVVPGLIVDACVAGAIGVWAYRRNREALVGTVAGEAFFIVLPAMLLIALMGPWISGDGLGAPLLVMVGRMAVALLVLTVGTALGILTAVATGVDPLTKAYHAHAQRASQRPKRR